MLRRLEPGNIDKKDAMPTQNFLISLDKHYDTHKDAGQIESLLGLIGKPHGFSTTHIATNCRTLIIYHDRVGWCQNVSCDNDYCGDHNRMVCKKFRRLTQKEYVDYYVNR